jgi:sugar phosphate isomerase/epimerase
MRHLDPEHFGICLDTGHLNLCPDKDQRNFILKAGNHLKALHIADNQGETDQHMMPFGRGNVDFIEVVRALHEIHYKGLFNLEIPGENHKPDDILGYKLEYICKCYDYLMKQI